MPIYTLGGGSASAGSGGQEVITYTADGTFTPPEGTDAANPLICDVIVTGGGGGGSGHTTQGLLIGGAVAGNGGNAGQTILARGVVVTGPTSVTIGAGGAGGVDAGTNERFGFAGGATSFGSITALGGYGGNSPGTRNLPTPLMPDSSAGGVGDGAFVFCVVSSTTAGAMSSPDGITWTSRTMPANQTWTQMAVGNGMFVAGTNTSGVAMAYTADGATWGSTVMPSTAIWNSIAFGNGIFVAGAPAVLATSTGGPYFAARTPFTANLTALVFGRGVFVALTQGVAIWTSPDGVTWTQQNVPTAFQNYTTLLFAGDLFFLTRGTNSSTTYLTSPDGITWTHHNSFPTGGQVCTIAYGNGMYVAGQSASSALVHSSPDGFAWTARTMPSSQSNGWRAVSYGNGIFSAVGATTGTSNATSVDGITWTQRTTTPLAGLWNAAVARGPGAAPLGPSTVEGHALPTGGSAGNNTTTGSGGNGGRYGTTPAQTLSTSSAATIGQVPGAGGGGGGFGSHVGAAGAVGVVTVTYQT